MKATGLTGRRLAGRARFRRIEDAVAVAVERGKARGERAVFLQRHPRFLPGDPAIAAHVARPKQGIVSTAPFDGLPFAERDETVAIPVADAERSVRDRVGEFTAGEHSIAIEIDGVKLRGGGGASCQQQDRGERRNEAFQGRGEMRKGLRRDGS